MALRQAFGQYLMSGLGSVVKKRAQHLSLLLRNLRTCRASSVLSTYINVLEGGTDVANEVRCIQRLSFGLSGCSKTVALSPLCLPRCQPARCHLPPPTHPFRSVWAMPRPSRVPFWRWRQSQVRNCVFVSGIGRVRRKLSRHKYGITSSRLTLTLTLTPNRNAPTKL